MASDRASQKTDDYLLGRDKAESVRCTGYIIHPSISLPANARIADVATGTGAWALHASLVLPEGTQIVGFDISPSQFPQSKPQNVQFAVADAKQPFAEADHGTFDLVHIRALLGAMQPSDWDIVMRNGKQLLKPGGSLQWLESDFDRTRCLRGNPEPAPCIALPLFLDKFKEVMVQRMAGSVDKLCQAARAHFERVEYDLVSSDRLPDLRTDFSRVNLQAMLQALMGWAQKTGEWTPQYLETLKHGIDAEIASGAYIRVDVFTVLAHRS